MFQSQFSLLSFIIKFIIYSAILVFFLLFSPFLQDYKPKEYSFQFPFDFTGVLSKNDLLDKSQKMFEEQVKGPESLAVYKGAIYTGTLDGRIVRINLNENKLDTITRLIDGCGNENQENPNLSQCGRPLGLRFNERGSLFVIDAYFGLWKIDNVYDYPQKDIIKSNLLPLRDLKVGCRNTELLDDLVIDGNTVYISDVSGKWNLEHYFYILSEPETKGRIIKYDINSKKLEVILNDLWAPKGLELTDDREALLICEAVKRRIIKYYIRGEKAGKTEVFSDALPGEPENIRRGSWDKSVETYWITLSSARTIREPSTWDYFSEYPTIRLFVVRSFYAVGALIEFIGNTFDLQPFRNTGVSIKRGQNPIMDFAMSRYTIVAELDYQGLIVNTYHSSEINDLSEAREVRQSGNRYLYLGSNSNAFIGKFQLENSTKTSDKLRHRRH